MPDSVLAVLHALTALAFFAPAGSGSPAALLIAGTLALTAILARSAVAGILRTPWSPLAATTSVYGIGPAGFRTADDPHTCGTALPRAPSPSYASA